MERWKFTREFKVEAVKLTVKTNRERARPKPGSSPIYAQ